MRRASASWLTSPKVAVAVPPACAISSTRLSTPPQLASRSPGALCSLATPVERTSDTTTVTPFAASARAVELPMPTGLPQPVISATRAGWGIESSLSCLRRRRRSVAFWRLLHQRQRMPIRVAKERHPQIVIGHAGDQMRRSVKADAALRQLGDRKRHIVADEVERRAPAYIVRVARLFEQ